MILEITKPKIEKYSKFLLPDNPKLIFKKQDSDRIIKIGYEEEYVGKDSLDITTQRLNLPPANRLQILAHFRSLAESSLTKEVAAVYLTNQHSIIVPVFAQCGAETSVAVPYEPLEAVEALLLDPSVNTLVKLHTHPHRILPDFSPGDKRSFQLFEQRTEWAVRNLWKRLQFQSKHLSFYDGVTTYTDQSAWDGFEMDIQTQYRRKVTHSLLLHKASEMVY